MKPTRRIHVGKEFPIAAALQEQRRPGTAFLCEPGIHLLPGVWAFDNWQALQDDCAIGVANGGGRDETILRLDPGAERNWQGKPQGDKSLNPLWVGKNCTVEDVTIDGNEKAFRAEGWYVASGLRAAGGGLTARRLRITGLRGAYVAPGTAAGAIECFGISTCSDSAGGNVIEDIVFDGIPANAYFSAVYIGAAIGTNGETPARSFVRRIESRVGSGNWFLAAAGCNAEFEDMVGSGHLIGLYNDHAATLDVAVRRMTVSGCEKAVGLKDQDGSDKSGITLEDCTFRFRAGGQRFGVELWDTRDGASARATMGPVGFARCQFIPAGRTRFILASVLAPEFAGVQFADCIMPEGAKSSIAPATPADVPLDLIRCTTPAGNPVERLIPL
jgi:hypothetical protein